MRWTQGSLLLAILASCVGSIDCPPGSRCRELSADASTPISPTPPPILPADAGPSGPDSGIQPPADAGSLPDAGCLALTCASLGANCGNPSDGCGGTLSCGTCTAPQTCSGGGTPNVCGAPSTAGDVVVAAAGDIAGSGNAQETTAQILDALAADAVLTLGDDQYDNGALADFMTYFAPSWGRHLATLRPSPGNHDHGNGTNNQLAGYCAYFGSAAQCQAGGTAFYSFDLGNWHFISLDSGDPGSIPDQMAPGTPMMTWLAADLAQNTKLCTIAYWHHPRFSSDDTHGNDTVSSEVWTALYNANVDIVLNGHAHTYERFAPQDPSQNPDPARGITEWVVGTGGAPFYGFVTPQPNSLVRLNSSYGVLKLTLHAASYDWQFVGPAGSPVMDSGSGNCH